MATNMYDAKNLPFDQPGAGASNYGVDRSNVRDKFTRIWNDRATEDGGSKQIYDKLVQWASPEAVLRRDPNADPNSGQWALLRRALETGQLDPGLKDETLLRGMDLGLRETARFQQHKPVNFFTEYVMDPLIQTGLGMIPGVGVPLAVAYGGIKGAVEDGLMGGLLGAASGYGAGKLGQWGYGAGQAAGGVSSFLDDPLAWAGNVGGKAVDDVAGMFGFGDAGGAAAGAGGGGGATATAQPGFSAGLPPDIASGVPLATPPAVPAAGSPTLPGVGVGDMAGAAANTGQTAAAGLMGDVANAGLPTIAPSASAGAASLGNQAMGALGRLGITGANAPLLGLQLANALQGPQNSRAMDRMQDQAAPLNAQAQQLFEFYNSGQIQPADEQRIGEWQRAEEARINDYWQRAGAPQSTGRIQMLEDVGRKAQALRDQTRQGYLMQALQAAGLGTQATSTLAQLEALGDREASAALEDFFRNWALTSSYGRYGNTGAPGTTGLPGT